MLRFLSSLLRRRRNLHTLTDLHSKTEEWLYIISHRALGWPGSLNRWLYPRVYRWDKDEGGRLVIPALITFPTNPRIYIDYETRAAFNRHLNSMIPGPWRLDWSGIGQGFMLAERQPRREVIVTGFNEAEFHNVPTYADGEGE